MLKIQVTGVTDVSQLMPAHTYAAGIADHVRRGNNCVDAARFRSGRNASEKH